MEKPTPKEFSAIAFALAVVRGRLSAVLEGDVERGDVEQTLRGTSASNIAAGIGLSDAEWSIDWNEHLTEQEKRAIQGANVD